MYIMYFILLIIWITSNEKNKKFPSSSSGVGYCDRCTIIFIWSNIQIKNKEIDFLNEIYLDSPNYFTHPPFYTSTLKHYSH